MIDAFFEALGYRRKEAADTSIEFDSNYEYAKARYEGYLRDRQAYLQESLEISDRFDKAILTSSGGSLALSLTFIEKIAPSPLAESLWILFAAWILLICSLLFGVSALFMSQMGIQHQIVRLDQSYKDFLEAYEAGEIYAIPDNAAQGSRARKLAQWLNILSLVFLGFGVLYLCEFSFINLQSKAVASPPILRGQLQMPTSASSAARSGSPFDLSGSPLQQAKPNVSSGILNPQAKKDEHEASPTK